MIMLFLLRIADFIGRFLYAKRNGFHIRYRLVHGLFSWISDMDHSKTKYYSADGSYHSRLFGLLYVEYRDSYEHDWGEIFGCEPEVDTWGIKGILSLPHPEFDHTVCGTVYKSHIRLSAGIRTRYPLFIYDKHIMYESFNVPRWLIAMAETHYAKNGWQMNLSYNEENNLRGEYRTCSASYAPLVTKNA